MGGGKGEQRRIVTRIVGERGGHPDLPFGQRVLSSATPSVLGDFTHHLFHQPAYSGGEILLRADGCPASATRWPIQGTPAGCKPGSAGSGPAPLALPKTPPILLLGIYLVFRQHLRAASDIAGSGGAPRQATVRSPLRRGGRATAEAGETRASVEYGWTARRIR
jgi:hypothetical protein